MNPGVDTAIWISDLEITGAPQFNGAVPFKGIIIPPSLWTNAYFPSVKKNMDPSRGSTFNDPSTRPAVLYRFSVYGEWQRWLDLVPTHTLVTRVKALNPEAGNNIQAFHMLRSIPQSQIDIVVDGPPFPQNTGY